MSEESNSGVVDPETSHEPVPESEGRPRASRRRGFGVVPLTVLAAVLVLVVVAGTAVAAVMFSKVHDQDQQDRQRADALTAAEQFSLRMDAVDGAHVDTYVNRIQQTLTTKAKSDFGKQFDSFKKVYQQAKATGSGKVLMAGVQDSDTDSATVLVVHDATVKSTYGSQTRHQRWSVAMAKVDGRWLVDSFSPVT